jgi:hypothetical protein
MANLAELMAYNMPKSAPNPLADVMAQSNGARVFDPESDGYDYKTALKYNMGPTGEAENKGHWGSVAPVDSETRELYKMPENSYVVLKGRQHPTFEKAVEAEKKRGSKIIKIGDRYYSVPGGWTQMPKSAPNPLAEVLAQGRMPNVPQQDAGILDDELLRHHYMNIAKGTAVENEDGSLSTVYSTSVQHPDLNDGEPTLVPSVWDGEILIKKDKDGNPIRRPDGKTIVDEDKAAEKAIKSGRKWTSASTHEQLRAHDILLHQGMKRISPEEAEIELLRWAK